MHPRTWKGSGVQHPPRRFMHGSQNPRLVAFISPDFTYTHDTAATLPQQYNTCATPLPFPVHYTTQHLFILLASFPSHCILTHPVNLTLANLQHPLQAFFPSKINCHLNARSSQHSSCPLYSLPTTKALHLKQTPHNFHQLLYSYTCHTIYTFNSHILYTEDDYIHVDWMLGIGDTSCFNFLPPLTQQRNTCMHFSILPTHTFQPYYLIFID